MISVNNDGGAFAQDRIYADPSHFKDLKTYASKVESHQSPSGIVQSKHQVWVKDIDNGYDSYSTQNLL